MKKTDFTEEIMNNNSLVEYLESEIEKLKTEIENKKNRHYVNQNIIEECQERIKQYRDREDSVFSLLSPISVESSYKLKIAEENKIIEETNSENMVLISEIDECNNKIQEIEKQLSMQKAVAEAAPSYEDNYSGYSSTPETEGTDMDSFGEDWISFINKVLEGLDEAEEHCYSNPKTCKDKIIELKKYINEMCFGDND